MQQKDSFSHSCYSKRGAVNFNPQELTYVNEFWVAGKMFFKKHSAQKLLLPTFLVIYSTVPTEECRENSAAEHKYRTGGKRCPLKL